MVNEIKTKYNHNDECYSKFETSFFIKDDDDRCEATLENNNSTIYVENRRNIEIHFFAIDNCVITSTLVKKCDACITDNKNLIIFLEIKEISYSNDRRKNLRKKSKHAAKAVKQIASTINDFKNRGIDLSQIRVEGIISFPPLTNQTNPTTIPQASSQARISQLQRLCGFSNLNIGNHIIF